MITLSDYEDFVSHVIAQDDDQDYSESGYVAVRKDDWAAIAKYSHCSCYGTWDSLTDRTGKPAWDWEGTPGELVGMAIRMADPCMPDRVADEKDYDYDHLVKVYQQVLDWARENDVAPADRPSGGMHQPIIGE